VENRRPHSALRILLAKNSAQKPTLRTGLDAGASATNRCSWKMKRAPLIEGAAIQIENDGGQVGRSEPN